MAVVITIQGVDRTSLVQWSSLKIENILTKQVDKCSFKLWKYGDKTFKPVIGREVIITDNGTRVFAGVIVRTSVEVVDYPKVEYSVECSDYTRILDQHLIADTYENMTINAIIAHMVANWLPTGFTATQVDATQVIDYIQFNYEPASDCIKQLADIVGYDWYVDYFRDIYFKSPTATSASIDITDSGGVYDHNSLTIRHDSSQLRNSIIVRGGEYRGSEFTASIKSDGKRITYELPYRFEDFKVRVNGVKQAIGIDNIDNTLSFDALYNFSEKSVKWRENNKPVQDATLSYSGKPYLPVIVKLKSPVDIAAVFSAEQSLGDGKYEYLVVDKSINTKEAARERALAEIRSYGESISEGEFTTETTGLRAGQRILVNSTVLGINEYYVINRVISVMKDDSSMRYKISLVTTKTMDFIAIMKKLLLAETKKITVNEGEIIDLVESLDETMTLTESMVASLVHNPQTETMTMTETFTAQQLNYPTAFVVGDYTPTVIEPTLRFSNTSTTTNFNLYGSLKWGETFTTTSGFKVGMASFSALRVGSPGTFTIAIYATAAGIPTGSPLTSATFNGNLVSTSAQQEVSVFLPEYTLSGSTVYALTLLPSGGDVSNYLQVRYNSSSTLANANLIADVNGDGWDAPYTSFEAYFKLWDSDYKRVFILNGSPLG